MNHTQFKRARQRLGLSVTELAAILDTHPRTIRKWESDPERYNNARSPNPVACQVLRWIASGELRLKSDETT